MYRLAPILLAWLCVFTILPLKAHAEALTDDTIRSFIDSLKALQEMEGNLDDTIAELSPDDTDQMPDLSQVFSSSMEHLKGHDVYNKLEEVVEQHGFDSAEQWSRIGDRIFHAWTAIEMGDGAGEMNQEMQKAMAEINNSPHMSEAQKQAMRDMMGGAVSAMQEAANAPEADMRAVRPHMDTLRNELNVEE